MKYNFFICIVLLSLDCSGNDFDNSHNTETTSAITWCQNTGRFGDQLISYLKAEWLGHKYNIPLLYVPFNYSDQLMIHEQVDIYSKNAKQLFPHIIHLPTELDFDLFPDNNTLYISYWKLETDVDFNDIAFIEKLRRNISPRYPLEKVSIPDDCISIAVHVRTGGGFHFDSKEKREQQPLRFASETFFIEQIARIADMFSEQNLYVYIFTDHEKPAKLKKRFQNALNNPRITFDYRHKDNSHNSNVLEDFFSMMTFDCLIRPASSFSKIVQYIGDNKIVIYPSGSRKNADGTSTIDNITIYQRSEFGDRWQSTKINLD